MLVVPNPCHHFFFFWIGNEKIILRKNSLPEYIGDVLCGQKSRPKITMIT